MKTLIQMFFSVGLIAATGCASTSKRFSRISPGMSSEEVSKTMNKGPTTFQNPQNSEYTTWFFGSDYCVLFKNDHVVAKEKSIVENSVVGIYSEKQAPQCLAPGQTDAQAPQHTVSVPGIGSFNLHKSKAKSAE